MRHSNLYPQYTTKHLNLTRQHLNSKESINKIKTSFVSQFKPNSRISQSLVLHVKYIQYKPSSRLRSSATHPQPHLQHPHTSLTQLTHTTTIFPCNVPFPYLSLISFPPSTPPKTFALMPNILSRKWTSPPSSTTSAPLPASSPFSAAS